jgi:hypothetical protein
VHTHKPEESVIEKLLQERDRRVLSVREIDSVIEVVRKITGHLPESETLSTGDLGRTVQAARVIAGIRDSVQTGVQEASQALVPAPRRTLSVSDATAIAANVTDRVLKDPEFDPGGEPEPEAGGRPGRPRKDVYQRGGGRRLMPYLREAVAEITAKRNQFRLTDVYAALPFKWANHQSVGAAMSFIVKEGRAVRLGVGLFGRPTDRALAPPSREEVLNAIIGLPSGCTYLHLYSALPGVHKPGIFEVVGGLIRDGVVESRREARTTRLYLTSTPQA